MACSTFPFKNLYWFFSVYVYVPRWVHTMASVWSWGVGFFLPLCVSGELQSGHQAWRQVLYPISHLPSSCFTFPKETQNICFWRYRLPLEIKIKTKKWWCVHVYDVWVVVVRGQFYGVLSCLYVVPGPEAGGQASAVSSFTCWAILPAN